MRKEKWWIRLAAVSLGFILSVNTPVIYALDDEPISIEQKTEVKEATDIQKGTEVRGNEGIGEKSILPSVLIEKFMYEGRNFKVPLALGSEINSIDTISVKIDGTEIKSSLNEEQDALEIQERIEEKVEPGIYALEVTFRDKKEDIVAVDNQCEITVPEAAKPSVIPADIDYEGKEDIVLPFKKGNGYYTINSITEVILEIPESIGSAVDYDDKIILSYEKEDFSYDLEKCEFLIKREALACYHMITGIQYDVIVHGDMVNGEEFELQGHEKWKVNYTDKLEGNESEYESEGIDNNKEEEKSENVDKSNGEYGMEEVGANVEGDESEDNVEKSSLEIQTIDKTDVDEEALIVELTEGNTDISQEEMQDIVDINQKKDVVIHSTDGIVFTFIKESMKMVEGKTVYDFGVTLITDYEQAEVDISKEDFVFKIVYNYTGALPGTASVDIPLDSKWSGREVYYSVMDVYGIPEYMTMSTVGSNGVYTIPELKFTHY